MTNPGLPSNVAQIFVAGTFRNFQGNALAQRLVLSPSLTVTINAGAEEVTLASEFSATPDPMTGFVSIPVVATDDPDLNPTNFTYTVTEPSGRKYPLAVSQDTPVFTRAGHPLSGQRVVWLHDAVPAPGPSSGVVQIVAGPQGPMGEVSAAQLSAAVAAAKLADRPDVSTAGAAVDDLFAFTQVGGSPAFGKKSPGSLPLTDASNARFSRLAGSEGHVLTGQNRVQVISMLATGTSRVPYKIVTAGGDIRLLFTNYQQGTSGNGYTDLDNTADITVASTVELDGVFYKVTFSGQATRAITGGGSVLSDPIGLDLAAGTWIWVRTFVTVTGTNCPANRVNYTWDGASATGGGGFTATTDLTTSGTIADAAGFLYGPSVIYGVSDTPLPHVVGVGDSIMAGKLDGNGEGGHIGANKGGGWFERAFADQRATVNIGRGGETGASFVLNTSHFRRARFITPGTWVVEAYGRNDLGTGATLATVQATRIAAWAMATRRGAKVAAATVTPVTTSTDTWATTANQTIANAGQEAVRVGLNQWLRDGAPMLNGAAVAVGSSAVGTVRAGLAGHPVSLLLDVSTAAESAQDSGIWKAGYSKDGTHPKNAGYAAMAAVVNPALFV